MSKLMAMFLGVALIVSGCSSGSSGSGSGHVTLSYAVWDPNQVPAMKADAAAFHTLHPKITIDVQQTPYADYFTELQTAAGGGSASDVFWMNGPNFQLYASHGVLAPLRDVITQQQIDTSSFPSALVKLYTYKGTQYGIPKDFDTIGVWYNEKLFAAAGVPTPSPSWTWAQFDAVAHKLTIPAKRQYGVAAELEGQEYFYNTIYQAGGQVISTDGRTSGYDQPATIAGLEFWTNLIRDKVSPDLRTMTDTTPLSMFESGKTAMYWGGSWDAAEFGSNDYTRNRVDVLPPPTGVKQATIIHGVANVMWAKTKHKTEAAEFIGYLSTAQAARTLATAGVIPAVNGTQSSWVSAHPHFHLQVFLDELKYAVPYPISQNTAAWNDAEAKYLTAAWSGKMATAAAAHALAAAMNTDLAKEEH